MLAFYLKYDFFPVLVDVIGIIIGRRVLCAECVHIACRLGFLFDPVYAVGVQIDHGVIRQGEHLHLGRKIIFKILVLYGADVVFGYIEENAHVKAHVVYSVILEGLTGSLHLHVGDAGGDRVEHMLVQFHGFRCRDMGFCPRDPVVIVYG